MVSVLVAPVLVYVLIVLKGHIQFHWVQMCPLLVYSVLLVNSVNQQGLVMLLYVQIANLAFFRVIWGQVYVSPVMQGHIASLEIRLVPFALLVSILQVSL
jgi:hypothetical protein